MTLLRTLLAATLLTGCAVHLQAEVATTFDESTLHPNVKLDVPDPALAEIKLDDANDELDVTTTGNTDMWANRTKAPIAWTDAPTVAPGEKWYVETEVRFDTDVSAGKWRLMGITFYGGPDGSGGSNGGMDFTYSLDNWNDGQAGGYNPIIQLQGLGDNDPATNVDWFDASAFLRVEVTENGAADSYDFFYKAAAGDPWTHLTAFDSSVANSRAAVYWKNGGGTAEADRSGEFTYFEVGAVPEPSAYAMLAAAGIGLLLWRRRR